MSYNTYDYFKDYLGPNLKDICSLTNNEEAHDSLLNLINSCDDRFKRLIALKLIDGATGLYDAIDRFTDLIGGYDDITLKAIQYKDGNTLISCEYNQFDPEEELF